MEDHARVAKSLYSSNLLTVVTKNAIRVIISIITYTRINIKTTASTNITKFI